MRLPSNLVVSCQAARRWQAARSWLDELALTAPALLIGPSRGAVDDFLRTACSGGSGRFAVRRTTPRHLAHELAAARLAARSLLPLSELGAEALATRAVFAAYRERELDYFQPVARLPGFPRALRATLDELRLEGVTAEALHGVAPGGSDLRILLERFEAELERWSLADRAMVLEAACGALAAGALAAQPVLWLDPQLRCDLDRRFVAAVAERATHIFTAVQAGDPVTREGLETIFGHEALDLDAGAVTSRRLDRVQRYVFEPDVPPPESSAFEDEGTVQFFSAPGEGQECVEIARRVRDLARAGLRFDRMAVLLRSPTSYLPLLEDALRRAEIPAYFTRGTARPDPAGRAFLALLACAGEDLSASRFAEYLSLGQVPVLSPEGAPPRREVPWVEPVGDQFVFKSLVAAEPPERMASAARDELAEEAEEDVSSPGFGGSLSVPGQWERLLVDAAVVGGSERWHRRLAGLEAELELQLQDEGPQDEGLRAHLGRQLERLGHLRRFALPLVEMLAELPAEARWGEWLERLELLAVRALRRPRTVLELLAELRPMEDVGPVDLEQVRAVLHERLVFLRREPPRRRYGSLFVATVEEVAGRSFDVVFVPGLAEGTFPRPAFEDPLLLDELRQRLGRELQLQSDRLLRERSLLRLAVGAAARNLVLSYSSLDLAIGRSRVPSFYALDVLRAAEGELPALRELQRRGAEGRAPRLGWPAPSDCEAAIDDAEYDLALLQPLLRRGGPEVRGQGRFLLECNEHLARALRSRWRRWHWRWCGGDGLVLENDGDDEAVRALLAQHRLRARSYSPTALQHFAGCPYRFFLQAILRLRPRDELVYVEQLDPLTRGSLFHQTQFALFGALEEAGLLPLEPDQLGRILDVVDAVLDETAAEYAEELAPAISRVWRSEIEGLRTDLRGWLLQVMERDRGWRPVHFELAFGLAGAVAEGRDEASRSEPEQILDGVKVRGSIDLVERERDGARHRVTDHKTGRPPQDRIGAVGGGRVLQPLLYALAMEDLLGAGAGSVSGGRLYFCTQRGGYEIVEVPLDDETRGRVAEVLDTIDDGIARGFLPAAPEKDGCRYCDYRPVCGPYEEIRVARKRPEPLAGLIALRGLK